MTEIEGYLDQLRACFADLPTSVRVELLDDVAEHLAEVAAEADGPLVDRLGPPEQYAADLRTAAGLPAPGTAPTTAFGRWKRRLAGLDRRIGPVVGYERSSDLLRQLAPAWWVLRGYAAVAVLLWAVDGPSLVPTIGGNAWAGGLVTAAAVVASVWLGRRRPRAVPLRALAGAAQLVFAGLVLATVAQAAVVFDRYDEPRYPAEAEATVPEPPQSVMVCFDPDTGVSRLVIGSGNAKVCQYANLVDQLRRAGSGSPPPTPSPAPS